MGSANKEHPTTKVGASPSPCHGSDAYGLNTTAQTDDKTHIHCSSVLLARTLACQ